MRRRTTTSTAAITLALTVALGGCASNGEPTESTSTASGPSNETDDTELAKAADEAYRDYWTFWNASSPADRPGEKQRALMTDEAYQNVADYTAEAAPTKAEGRDRLLSTDVTTDWSAGGPTATVDVCYEVHRQFVLTENVKSEDGKTVKKGTDIRTDADGKPIKAGTELGHLVTMKRDREDGSQWKVHATEAGHDEACSGEGETQDEDD